MQVASGSEMKHCGVETGHGNWGARDGSNSPSFTKEIFLPVLLIIAYYVSERAEDVGGALPKKSFFFRFCDELIGSLKFEGPLMVDENDPPENQGNQEPKVSETSDHQTNAKEKGAGTEDKDDKSTPGLWAKKIGAAASRMKIGVEALKGFLAILKDTAIVACFAAVLLFPSSTEAYLRALGFTSVPTPIGEIDLAKSQLNSSTQVINQLDAVQNSLPENSEASLAVQQAIDTVRAGYLQAESIVSPADPAAVSTNGWIYLGTSNSDESAWVGNVGGRTARTTDIGSPSEVKLYAVAPLVIDVNLRGDEPLQSGPLPKVIGVLRHGQCVKILGIDSSRPAQLDQPNGHGKEIFANVELTQNCGANQ